jgi:hypothetical protein
MDYHNLRQHCQWDTGKVAWRDSMQFDKPRIVTTCFHALLPGEAQYLDCLRAALSTNATIRYFEPTRTIKRRGSTVTLHLWHGAWDGCCHGDGLNQDDSATADTASSTLQFTVDASDDKTSPSTSHQSCCASFNFQEGKNYSDPLLSCNVQALFWRGYKVEMGYHEDTQQISTATITVYWEKWQHVTTIIRKMTTKRNRHTERLRWF